LNNVEIYSKRKYPSPVASIEMYEVTYWSDGLRVKGLLAMPKKQGNYDALLYLRGGLQSIGMVRPARIAQFALKGFIVFAPYYRGNRGGEGKDEFAGADRFDAVYAVDVLKKFSKQPTVHVYGFSRGGLMALWTTILRDDIASLVTWAGVSDMFDTYEQRVDMRRGMKRIIGGTPSKYPDRYKWRTPLFEIENVAAPVLILHGIDDQHVNISHSQKLQQALMNAGKQVEVKFEMDLKHHYPTKKNRETVEFLTNWMRLQAK
jgi:dipeptidyl aminopeptidase/acylaminoacyl peptidase